MSVKENLTRDHVGLTDTFAARRYFRKFEAITRRTPVLVQAASYGINAAGGGKTQ